VYEKILSTDLTPLIIEILDELPRLSTEKFSKPSTSGSKSMSLSDLITTDKEKGRPRCATYVPPLDLSKSETFKKTFVLPKAGRYAKREKTNRTKASGKLPPKVLFLHQNKDRTTTFIALIFILADRPLKIPRIDIYNKNY
jgi:hypothetical protein